MRYFLLLILLLLNIPEKTFAEELVRVKLVNYLGDTSKLTFEIKGNYISLNSSLPILEGVKYTLKVKEGKLILDGKDTKEELAGSLILIPESYNYHQRIKINGREYLGAIDFQIEEKEYIRPVNQLPLEDYLKGVVPFEVFPTWGIETLKAQALAARTYAVSHQQEIIDDTIHYQVYGGYDWKPNTTRAVEETIGEVITFHQSLIEAFYSASNGGITESNANVWGGSTIPYYPIQLDPYDPTHPWEFFIHQTQIHLEEIKWHNEFWWENLQEKDEQNLVNMKSWLHQHGYLGDIKILAIPNFNLSDERLLSERSINGSISIEFLQRLYDGTILYERLSFEDSKLKKIRPIIGGNLFKSYLIDSLHKKEGIYTMKGRGYGHGVGMSQWGAFEMGEVGKSYKEILQFYFPGTEITKIRD
jgi:stage II sporulation protein D